MINNWLKDKEILITGGTGSLGKELTKQLIQDHNPRGIRIFSRGELEQWRMSQEINRLRNDLGKTTPVAFLVGDVRDAKRLKRAMEGVDIVIHAAALKQVPSCEDNPLEAVQTNIHGAENVLNAALDCGVKKVMNVSTDKAVKPVNLYGATKLAAEKLFINGNVYSGRKGTIFSCCRYGNVLGSRGSVAHVFKEQIDSGQPITITHKAMTRFWITIPRVAQFILARLDDMKGGEIFVPKMKSMGLYEMACAMAGWNAISFKNRTDVFQVTGIRQGEKLHEILFCEEEYVVNKPNHYEVYPRFNKDSGPLGQDQWELSSNRNPNGELSAEDLLAMLAKADI